MRFKIDVKLKSKERISNVYLNEVNIEIIEYDKYSCIVEVDGNEFENINFTLDSKVYFMLHIEELENK